MKRIFSVLLVLAMLLSVCIPACAVENGATLLYSFNSFENKASGVFSGAWRAFQYSEDCAKTGKVSIKAVGGNEMETSGILWFSNHGVAFEKGKTYSVRFFTKSEKTVSVVNSMLYDNESSTYINATASQRAMTIGSWCEYVAVFRYSLETSTNVSVRVDVSGLNDAYVDDLEIYEGALEYDKSQWQDAEYTDIVPGETPETSVVPDDMTLADYTMDFENGSSVQVGGRNVTAEEYGNERCKSQLIADPANAANTVMKVWLASDTAGDGQYSGKNQNNNAMKQIRFSKSTASATLASGTIPAGATFKMTFRYYLPQEMESSNKPSFCYYYNTGTIRRLAPSVSPSSVHNQWHTVEMSWTNSTGSDQVITQGGLRLCGNNDSGNGWKTTWTAKGHGSTDNGITFNFGDRAIYLDDFRITITNADGTIAVVSEASAQAVTSGATSGNIYVDMNATVNGNGSKKAPFNTIEAARDYIRTISDSMTGDIIVNVKGGRFEVEKTIELSTADSGKNGHYIIYQPYGYDTDAQEEVILSGGKKVSGWTQSEISGVYKAPFEIDYIRNLYVNDKRAQRSRYNEYVTPIDWWDDTEDKQSNKDGFIIPGGIIKNPEKATNLEMYRSATFRSNWAVKGKAIANGENTIISMEQPYFRMHEYANYSILDWRITDNFRLENALEFLDEPGEWYHDADTDTLYYMPRAGETIENCEVIAPVTEQILTILGDGIDNRAENIIVRGFTFSDGAYKKTSRIGRANLQGATCYSVYIDKNGTIYGGFQDETAGNIVVTNAKNVSFKDNVIKHMGAVGLSMPDGVDNCEIDGNAIYDISSSAVIVGGKNHQIVVDWRSVPRNVHITNNIVGNTGVEYGTDCGIQGYYTNGLVISRNEIYNTGYSGISVGWTWDSTEDTKRNNVMEYNRIYNFSISGQDSGGIYTLGRQPNSIVRGNYMKCYEQYVEGLYHDSGSSGFRSTGNVIELPEDAGGTAFYKNHIGDGDLLFADNYSSNDYQRKHISNTAASFENNDKSQGITRSPEALKIRLASGLDAEHIHLRDVVDGYSENRAIQRIYLQTEEQKHLTPANINVGESLTLKTFAESINGDMTVLTSGLTYDVKDDSVLELSGNKLTAKAEGITTVEVKDSEGRTAQMQVTVGDEVVSFDVFVNKLSAKKDEEVYVNYRLKTKYTEFSGYPKVSELKVDDSSIAEILSDGTLKAKGNGAATVSVNAKIAGFAVSGSATLIVGEDTYRTFKILDSISKLTQTEIQNYMGSADSVVSEKKFVETLAAITQSDVSKICANPSDAKLTKEKMVAYGAEALICVYGVAEAGDTEFVKYTDRTEIDPTLMPKIALAYRNLLLPWSVGTEKFEPKKEITSAEAAEFLYRFSNPEKFTYIYATEGKLNRYEVACGQLFFNSINGSRRMNKQWGYKAIGEEIVEISTTGGTIPAKSGIWKGTDSVTIESGELVRKIVRENHNETSIVTFNNVYFEPGKKYVFDFDVKLADSHAANSKMNISVETKFTTAEGTGSMSTKTVTRDGWQHFSVPITIPSDMDFTAEGINHSVHIRMWNTAKYEILGQQLGTDDTVYTVHFKDMVFTEAADTTIASSSIADGEENVMVPIDNVYIYTGSAIDTSSVTKEKFSITGTDATIRDAEAISENVIRVGIDGCQNDTNYTLTVLGIPNLSDGQLYDTISWKTEPMGGKTGTIDFEDDTYLGVIYSGGTRERSQDKAYKNSSSVKVSTTALTNLYINGRFAGFPKFEIGKEYIVSYSIYSTTAGMRTGICKNHSVSDIYMVDVKAIPQNQWVRLSGTFKPTVAADVTDDILKINLWGDPGDYYIDEITIAELEDKTVSVYRPVIFKKGIPVSELGKGEADIEIKVKTVEGEKGIWGVLAQYDENGRLISTISATDTATTAKDALLKINLSDAKGEETKIFVMDSQTYEPYSDVICMDK